MSPKFDFSESSSQSAKHTNTPPLQNVYPFVISSQYTMYFKSTGEDVSRALKLFSIAGPPLLLLLLSYNRDTLGTNKSEYNEFKLV